MITKEGDMVCKMIGKIRRVRIWGWFCYTKLADVETELSSHHFEACNPQLHIHISDVHLSVTAIAEKEIVN